MCAEFYSIKLIFGETVRHQIPCSIFENEPRKIGYVTSQKSNAEKQNAVMLLLKSKVNTGYYISALLPKLLEDCHDLIGDNVNFIFQQDGEPV